MLDEKIRLASVTYLQTIVSALNNVIISDQQNKLIEAITRLAARDDYALDRQSKEIEDPLLQAIIANKKTPEAIYADIAKKLAEQSIVNRNTHTNVARDFNPEDNKPLHQHADKNHTWLTNDYVNKFMPKDNPDKGFIVLAPMRVDQLDALSVSEQLRNEKVRSIIIPVGPGHWRAIAIEKPAVPGGEVSVTLFDSFGPRSAKGIEADVRALLSLPKESTIVLAGPTHKQQDGYSCGDYVIAYTHQQAKKCGVAYEAAFVDALERGNDLRSAVIKKSETPSAPSLNVIHIPKPPDSKKPPGKTFGRRGRLKPLSPSSAAKIARKLSSNPNKSAAITTPTFDYEKHVSELEAKKQEWKSHSMEDLLREGQKKAVAGTPKVKYNIDEKIVEVDKDTQIALDEQLARQLQQEEFKKFK